jgi:hypothetical protein
MLSIVEKTIERLDFILLGSVWESCGDDLAYVVGGDLLKFFGVGFFHEGLVVAVDHVRGVPGPTRCPFYNRAGAIPQAHV